jgi:hypothetical protein
VALSVIGFDGTIEETALAKLIEAGAWTGGGGEVVKSGFTVSTPVAVRTVAVASGVAFVGGSLVTSTATENATVSANATSTNRIDWIVVEVNWATNAVTIKSVTGASPSAWPALTRDPGVLWQMPVARVTVRPGVSQLAAADVEACKPLPRGARVFDGSVTPGSATGATWKTASSVTVTDPGWAWRMSATGIVLFGPTGSGEGVLRVTVDGAAADHGASPRLATRQFGQVAAITTSSRVGSAVVRLEYLAFDVAGGDGPVELKSSSYNSFRVMQIPA